MSLDERIAEAVRTHTNAVTPPPTDVPGLLRRGRRRRRARGAGLICSVVAVGAIAAVVVIPDQDTRMDPPAVDGPVGDGIQVVTRDGVAVVPNLRYEQVVVTPDIGPSDLKQEGVVGWASTTEDEYADATDLTVAAPVFTEDIRWDIYCTGAPDLHYIFTIDPNASYFETGRCGGAAPETFPPAPRDGGVGVQYSANRRANPETLQARMFVTDHRSLEYQKCYEYSPPEGCDDLEPPQATGADLDFGVAIYESAPPVVVRMLGYDIFAQTTAFNTDYMLDRAVAAPTAASTLTYELTASDKERLVQVLMAPDIDELQLLVDGERVKGTRGLAGSRGPGVVLPPGRSHQITVAPSAGMSGSVDLGLVVFEAVD